MLLNYTPDRVILTVVQMTFEGINGMETAILTDKEMDQFSKAGHQRHFSQNEILSAAV